MSPEHLLLTAIDRYLQRLDTGHAGIGLARMRVKHLIGFQAPSERANTSTPKCGYLNDAIELARAAGVAELMDALSGCELDWQSYDSYPPAEIGLLFPEKHAFASIALRLDPAWTSDCDVGFFLIAPRTLYRDHHHPASELYVPLTGPTKWRFGTKCPWVERRVHQPVWNEPDMVHATLVEDVPFLCVYIWTENIHRPAVVDRADDWDEIEAELMEK